MFKKVCPFLYNDLLYENEQELLDNQYTGSNIWPLGVFWVHRKYNWKKIREKKMI